MSKTGAQKKRLSSEKRHEYNINSITKEDDLMKATSSALLIGALVFASLVSKAEDDKIGTIKKAVAAACGGKSVDDSEAKTRYLKELYVKCNSGDKVDMDGCKISCLKGNAGAVAGAN